MSEKKKPELDNDSDPEIIIDEGHQKAIDAEHKAIAECALDGKLPCMNKPPSEPYFVETEEEIVARRIDPIALLKDAFTMQLDMDVYVETAARLDVKTLRRLLTATCDGHCTSSITVGVSPEQLARKSEGKTIMSKEAAEAWEKASASPGPDGWCEMDVDALQGFSGQRKKRGEQTWSCAVVLDYPLSGQFFFEVPLKIWGERAHVGELVWAICQAYRVAYADPKKYGVWGHALDDLVIEYIMLDTEGLIVVPGIGS